VTNGSRLKRILPLLLATSLAGCQIGGSVVSEREGYFTWVDEQGRVRYSPIAGATGEEPEQPTGEEGGTDAAAPAPAGTGPKPELREETEYTLENYPDAGQLEKDGYVRPGERQPYFTWRDAEGNVRVDYYQPDTRSDRQKGLVAPPVRITEARVYHAGPDTADRAPVPGHDPDAFTILGIEPAISDYFSRFSEACCESMDIRHRESWQSGREFGIALTESSQVHPFLTGPSPYQVVELPGPDRIDSFVMRLRSYARNGVLVPSLVFLDDQMKPLRLVTDLVMDFEPENWRRRGYLEAWIPAFPARGERWMVVFTRAEDLSGQTVIETPSGPRKIPHVSEGAIGLMQLED